jgi:hypothetical protein
MTQPIWFDSSEVGAPTLNNAAGSLLEILRACLINGFGSKTVTSISVTAGVATATCAAHGFLGTYGKLVLIEGSGEALLNGQRAHQQLHVPGTRRRRRHLHRHHDRQARAAGVG